jgi:small subunit ribosomal protein S6
VTRDYELALILHPEVSQEQTRSLMERIEQIVAEHGGQIVKVDQRGTRRLAYPIQRQRDGIYVFIDMILTPETVNELERMLKVSEIVLRRMMRHRDPKVVQKEREERAEREARAAAAPAEAQPEAEAPAEPEAVEAAGEAPAPSEEEAAEAAPTAESTETIEA